MELAKGKDERNPGVRPALKRPLSRQIHKRKKNRGTMVDALNPGFQCPFDGLLLPWPASIMAYAIKDEAARAVT